jgi:hypothetical protein
MSIVVKVADGDHIEQRVGHAYVAETVQDGSLSCAVAISWMHTDIRHATAWRGRGADQIYLVVPIQVSGNAREREKSR